MFPVLFYLGKNQLVLTNLTSTISHLWQYYFLGSTLPQINGLVFNTNIRLNFELLYGIIKSPIKNVGVTTIQLGVPSGSCAILSPKWLHKLAFLDIFFVNVLLFSPMFASFSVQMAKTSLLQGSYGTSAAQVQCT